MAQSLSTRGQVWNVDFIIGALLFTVVAVFFFIQLQGIEAVDTDKTTDLLNQARYISDELLTQGYPQNWININVIRAGITDNQRINQSKLDNLHDLNYSKLRTVFRARDDFFIFLEKDDGCLVQLDTDYGIGHSAVNVSGGSCRQVGDITLPDPDTLIPITRFVIYNGEPAKLTTYVWN